MSTHEMVEARQPRAQFMNEIVCSDCGSTAHITWDGTGETKRVIEMSDCLKLHPGTPPTFTCANCGAVQASI
ncbi:MAG TPA: hypothetical protein VHX99_06020 [Rhizomicrobium sp.]|jgi:ribosomal protein S27E|nr:hypothetical protein [Rhizomicrobium sp.]